MGRNNELGETLGATAIRAWRKLRELTLEETAARMTERGTPVTRTSLSRIERGLQPYSQRQIETMAATFECTPADLVDDVGAERDRLRLRALIGRLAESDRERVMRMMAALVN